MLEIDFLPVESETGPGSKSGDAIALRLTDQGIDRVVVIDAGYTAIGQNVCQHVRTYFNASHIDLLISTHPDADHLNGISVILEGMTVGELMIHRPRLHRIDVTEYSNIETIDRIIALAQSEGVTITEPFAGVTRFNGGVRILGPTPGYYETLLSAAIQETKSGQVALAGSATSGILQRAANLIERTMTYLPFETLTDESDVSARNNTSAITLLTDGDRRALFTGDAGVEALTSAATEYETTVGAFDEAPLTFFQAPHHGSRRNLGPTILNRILGRPGANFRQVLSFISSAKASLKHPSPKIVNALSRRNCEVYATEGRAIHQGYDAPVRPNWSTITPLPPLDESDE